MSSFRVTVTKVDPAPATDAAHPTPANVETQVFSQTVQEVDFDLQTFVVALNKKKRVRKPKSPAPRT